MARSLKIIFFASLIVDNARFILFAFCSIYRFRNCVSVIPQFQKSGSINYNSQEIGKGKMIFPVLKFRKIKKSVCDKWVRAINKIICLETSQYMFIIYTNIYEDLLLLRRGPLYTKKCATITAPKYTRFFLSRLYWIHEYRH